MISPAGDTFGDYLISGQIGDGGMATVYRAYDERLDRDVAIKLLHATFMRDESFRERFQREARIVARLEHPHIVPVYEYAQHEGVPFIVMKLIEGGTLKRRHIKQGASLDDIVGLLTKVADALTYAHEQGVLHRDIKPSNILIDERDQPYLTDFGLARIAQVGDSTISHDLMLGSPHYISPEQAMGARDLTPATDVYSLGVVLYELLVGAPPFSGDAPYAIVHEHIHTPPTALSLHNPDLSATVDAVVLKALAKAPTARYQTATALMEDFARALKASGVTELPLEKDAARVAEAEVARPVWTREDFAAEAAQIRELAYGMREKVKASRATRKAKGAAPEVLIRERVEKKFRARRTLLAHALVYVAVFGVAALNLVLSGSGGQSNWLDILAPAQLWGLGLAVHTLRYYFGQGPGAEQREAAGEREISREIAWNGADSVDEVGVRRRMAKKFKARRAIAMHAAVFLIMGLPIFLFDLFGPSRADQIGFVAFWGALLGWQCWRYFNRHGAGAAKREAEIQGEISRQMRLSEAREQERLGRLVDEGAVEFGIGGDKRGVRLTEEGELSDSFVEEAMGGKAKKPRP